MKTKESAYNVADYILFRAGEVGSFVSNLKLQKLLYYAQGWHLAHYQTELFNEKMEAWVHGPVIPSLYSKYRHYGSSPITSPEEPIISKETKEFLELFLQNYLPIDAYELELSSHREKPWIEARGDLQHDQPCSNEISVNTMKDYFTNWLHSND
jgi:uncharacterized phage-associated protein